MRKNHVRGILTFTLAPFSRLPASGGVYNWNRSQGSEGLALLPSRSAMAQTANPSPIRTKPVQTQAAWAIPALSAAAAFLVPA
jgi:hypothetical protein